MPKGRPRPKVKLTKTVVEELTTTDPRGERFYDSELQNFGMTVYGSGKRSWFIDYQAGNRRRRYVLGKYPDMVPTAARAAALRALAFVVEGGDPLDTREARRNALTFGEWVDEYLASLEGRKKPDSIAHDKLYLGRARERWERRPLADITMEDVERYLQLQKTRGVVTANRALASVKTCLEEAWRRDILDENVARRVRRLKEPPPRSTTLSEDQFKRLVEAIGQIGDRHVRAAFIILVETGARSSEVRLMRWEDLDLTDPHRALWRLPNPKRGHPEVKPLTHSTAAMLLELPRRPGWPYVVPSRHPDKPRRDFTYWWRWLRDKANLDGVNLHDVRRTFGLEVARTAGVHIASKLLGHSSVQITEKIYAPLGVDELRKAAETVSEARDAKVLPFKRLKKGIKE